MESFGSQPNHEMRSLKLKEVLAGKERLAHLASVPVVMANYQVQESWLFGGSSISQRFSDLEACSSFETLGTHLQIPLSSAESTDTLAVSSLDARAIRRALGD